MARFGVDDRVVRKDVWVFSRISVLVVVGFLVLMFLVVGYRVLGFGYNNNNKFDMDILGSIEMANGHLLCSEVKYGDGNRHDPKDTSNIYFEVVKRDDSERFVEGDLVKFHYRFLEKVQVDGGMYVVLNPDIVQYVIRKRNVQESLLKR